MGKTFRHINEDKKESMRFDLRHEQAVWKRNQRQNRRQYDPYLIGEHNSIYTADGWEHNEIYQKDEEIPF